MDCHLAYDISRLTTRVLNQTPNGIDRIDSAFACHFLKPRFTGHSAMLLTALGPRVVGQAAAADAVNGIFRHWGEDESPDADESFQRILSWIRGDATNIKGLQRVARRRRGQAWQAARWIGRHGFPVGKPPADALPTGALYLNVSQFPIWVSSYFHWLKKRPDLKAVFFIHDLLPIETPEYFRQIEYGIHLRRLANLAEFGAAAIVTTEVVKSALRLHLRRLGRQDMPILATPIPAAPIFSKRTRTGEASAAPAYFLACGTIEPRKNHLLLLHVWRELVRRKGAAAPKLILIGTRGWENENAVDLLERCRMIRDHVIEASGLSTPSYKALLDSACALLMPSFAEGYGLPVAEALAAGTPVIASDIPAFRETAGGQILTISPIDGERWLETVDAFAEPRSGARDAAIMRQNQYAPPDWSEYFAKIETFLASL